METVKKIKVTNFKVLDRVYATFKGALEVHATINSIPVIVYFHQVYGYIHDGADLNEVIIKSTNEKVRICSSGGTHKTYEITTGSFPKKDKQPKNLSFTGPYYETSFLKERLTSELNRILLNCPEKFSPEFIKTFNIF